MAGNTNGAPSAETQQMIDTCMRHSLYSWSARGKVKPMPIVRAEGIYLYGPDGEKWIDFNSQLMSVNIGHSHPKVVQAIKALDAGRGKFTIEGESVSM